MAAIIPIEVTGIVINPQCHRFDDGVIVAEVDCNGPLKKSNQHLWDAIESARGEVDVAVSSGQSLSLADGDSQLDLFARPPRKASPHLRFKGPSEEGDLKPQRTYHFYGNIRPYKDKRTGEVTQQFHFSMYRLVCGHGQAGVIRYLCDCPHIGTKTADKLWAKFQSDAVRILRENPDIAVAAVSSPHFTSVKAHEASEYLTAQQAMESCTIDLIELLGGRGFPATTMQAAVREWGTQAVDVIRRDPYRLGIFRGCGFLKVDKMAMALGIDPASMRRQAHCALFFLANDNEHTWSSAARVGKFIESKIGGANANPLLALKICKLAKAIEIRKIHDPVTGNVTQVWVALAKKAGHERTCCNRIVNLLSQPSQWPDVMTLPGLERLSAHHQLPALARATRKPLGILRGDPGTGKSFTTIEFILALERVYGWPAIAVCAQAGAAADRIKKDLVAAGSNVVPRTIHSTLGRPNGSGAPTSNSKSNPDKRDSGDMFFKHNADNPFPYRFVFLDEVSMPGADLMAAFLSACGTGTQVLLIGDDKQLPPISHGSVMRDCIAAGVPCGELTEPQRNAGTMVLACQDIKHGRRFRTDNDIDPDAVPPRNFRIIEAGTPEDQIKVMLERLDWAVCKGLDPIWDAQVVVAVNANSKLGRGPINTILQEKLNPNGARISGNPFRVGDKVVCKDNGDYLCVDRCADYAGPTGKCRISNGTFGRVSSVESKQIVVKFFHPDRDIIFTRTKPFEADALKEKNRPGKRMTRRDGDNGSTSDTDEIDGTDDKPMPNGCPVDLAYAGTCHMLQGSERKYVLPLLDEYPGAGRICQREWFFTGMSRGKWLTEMIGKDATARNMVRTAALPNRKTFLKEDLIQRLWGDL